MPVRPCVRRSAPILNAATARPRTRAERIGPGTSANLSGRHSWSTSMPTNFTIAAIPAIAKISRAVRSLAHAPVTRSISPSQKSGA